MPTKDQAPFSYISPQKTLFSTIKYELTIEFLSANGYQKTEKTGPPTNPASAPPQKFLLLLRYNLFIGVDKMRVKISPLLCRLGLVLRLGSV